VVLPLETLVSLLIIFFLYIGGGVWAERVAVRVLLPLRDPVTGSIHRDPETLPIGISLIVAPFQKAIGVRGNGAVRHLPEGCDLGWQGGKGWNVVVPSKAKRQEIRERVMCVCMCVCGGVGGEELGVGVRVCVGL
jgi:hypothetical protein